MALPIVGEFLTKAYADPKLGLNRADMFSRPPMMPTYECPDEAEAPETQADDTEFFE